MVDINWIYIDKNKEKNKDIYVWPLCVYRDDGKSIGHVNYIGVYTHKLHNEFYVNNFSKVVYLNEVESYNKFFGEKSNNNYHPNELSAEVIADFYMEKLKISDIHYYPAMNKFKEFLSNNSSFLS